MARRTFPARRTTEPAQAARWSRPGGDGCSPSAVRRSPPVSVRSATPEATADADSAANRTYPFYGEHQAGIVTPAQDRLAFASMNVLDGTSRSDLRVLLKDWTVAAERMTRGQLVGDDTNLDDPPLDTGEAIGSPVGGLTITIGYGPSLFDDRFGLSARKPALLTDLPALPNENLDPELRGRRPVHPGLLGRPAGGLPRRAEPGPSRARCRRLQLDGARLRQDVVDQHDPGDPAQPARLQGRHPQHQGRSRPTSSTTTSGSARTATRPGCAAAATSSAVASRSSSRTGTGTTSRTSRTSSAGPR